jgi:hypothetical protein
MVARHVRILVGSVFSASLLACSLVAPAAAAECVLIAPATANVGSPMTIQGTGFPASSDVDIALSVQGGPSDAFAVQSSASGELHISLTPEEAEAGLTTMTATAGSTCTAQVVFTVLGAGETPPPTSEPDGSAAGEGAEPTVPRTDLSSVQGESTAFLSGSAWFLALLILVVGAWGLIAGRSARSR